MKILPQCRIDAYGHVQLLDDELAAIAAAGTAGHATVATNGVCPNALCEPPPDILPKLLACPILDQVCAPNNMCIDLVCMQTLCLDLSCA